MNSRRSGFTLVELLVVIAIIGLLSTVAVMATNSARLNSRNAKRLSDMKQLLTAFQLGLDANGSYPGASGSLNSGASGFGNWNVITDNATVDAFIAPYMAQKPTYPAPSPAPSSYGYLYIGGWGGGTAPYDSTVYAASPILDWILEGSTTCGFGNIWSRSASYTECIFILKNS